MIPKQQHLSTLLLVVILALSQPQLIEGKGDHWAILVAGSNGFWNYRH